MNPKNCAIVGESTTALLLVLQIFSTLLIACSCKSTVSIDDKECQYSGDMGRVPSECIRKMRNSETRIRECDGIFYGPGLLYADREAIEFWVKIHGLDLPWFPDDLTYTIYRKTGDFNEPGALQWIEGCKSLNLESKCMLPTKNKGQTDYIYIPLRSSEYEDFWYCEFEIEEFHYTPKAKFCESRWQYECLTIEDDLVRMKTVFIPLMNGTIDSRYRYCAFTVTDDYLAPYGERNEPIYNIQGIKKTRRRITVSTEHNRTTHKRCKTFENRRGGNIFRKAEEVLAENLPENDGVCFFVQIPGKHPKWTAKPVCYRRSRNRVRVQ